MFATRTLTAMTMTIGLGLGASLMAPAVGEAAGSWGCPQGKSCYYEHHDGQGTRWIAPNASCQKLYHTNPTFNDLISSVSNMGGGVVHMYNWNGSFYENILDVPVGKQLNLYDDQDDVIDAVAVGNNICH